MEIFLSAIPTEFDTPSYQERTGFQVGPPAWWGAMSNVAGGSGTGEGAHGPLSREGRLISLDSLNYLQGPQSF